MYVCQYTDWKMSLFFWLKDTEYNYLSEWKAHNIISPIDVFLTERFTFSQYALMWQSWLDCAIVTSHTAITPFFLLPSPTDVSGGDSGVEEERSRFRSYLELSEVYYVYNTVHQFIVRDSAR